MSIVISDFIILVFPIGTTSPNPFDMGGMSSGVDRISNSASKNNSSHTGTKPKSTVETLLGEHSNLVNLDDLVTSGKQQGISVNKICYYLGFAQIGGSDT